MNKVGRWNLDRRKFLQTAATVTAAGLAGRSARLLADNPQSGFPAEYIHKLDDGRLQCSLCPNLCTPKEGADGVCRARGLRDGRYVSFVYGLPCVLAIDPVEKMPLFHYHVHSPALSISTAGCNLTCQYCQNWQFSQKSPAETANFNFKPEDVIVRALDFQVQSLGFFYTEPTVYIEFMKDIARLARKNNLKTIMVTAGYIQPKPLHDLFDLIDMFVVGYKGFTEEFYREVIGGSLVPVQNTLKAIKNSGRHLEVVSLLIPGKNDAAEHLQTGIDWFGANLGADVPWHFSRFAPEYLLKNLPPTPNAILENARKMAMQAGMKFVYTGNNPGQEGNHTYCSGCGKKVIERLGFKVMRSLLSRGKCPDCGVQIPGVWLDDLPNGNI